MKRSHLTLGIALAVGVVIALLVVVLATSPPATDRIAKSPLVGKPAPAIVARTVEGKAFDLTRYEGEWVLLNFFATWCTPCKQEHPELRAFSEQHAKSGDAQVVSVMFNDDPALVRAFFAQRGGDWPVVVDAKATATLAYGVAGIPESYLIAPSGVVAAKITGGVTAVGLDKVIADISTAAEKASKKAGGN